MTLSLSELWKEITASQVDEELIHSLIDLLPTPLIYKTDKHFYINTAMLTLIGYKPGEITSLSDWYSKISPNTLQNNSEFSVLILTKKDGAKVSVARRIKQFTDAEIWALNDITAQQRTAEALYDSENQLSGIINSAMDAIITVDNSQRIVLFNKAAEDIFGYRSRNLIGHSLNKLIPPRFHEVHHTYIDKFAQTGTTTRKMGHLSTLWGIRANGEEFPIEASISQTIIGGEKFHTVILRDVTERKYLEDELKRAQQERLARKQEELLESYKKADYIFSALADILPGTILDSKYKLEKKLGMGGYGIVYQALHLGLNRPVAVKIFRPIGDNENKEHLDRFRLEGISTCRVNHANAVTILDAGVSPEGIVYLVMELLEGHSLEKELYHKKSLSVQRCLEILIPVCQVLAEAHRAGIVHRDIKPDNIFLHQVEGKEVIKVVDFGIAKFLDHNSGTIDLRNLTVQGIILGTPVYMSPERLNNQLYDGRADIYSLGITFYQMISGNPPFDQEFNSIFALAILHITQLPDRLSKMDPHFPIAIEELLLQILSKDPQERPTAEALAQTLQNLLNTLPPEQLEYRFTNTQPRFFNKNETVREQRS